MIAPGFGKLRRVEFELEQLTVVSTRTGRGCRRRARALISEGKRRRPGVDCARAIVVRSTAWEQFPIGLSCGFHSLPHFALVVAAHPGEVLSDPRMDRVVRLPCGFSSVVGVGVCGESFEFWVSGFELEHANGFRALLRHSMGCDGNGHRPNVHRVSVEPARRLATIAIALDSDRIVDRHLWRVISRGLVCGIDAQRVE